MQRTLRWVWPRPEPALADAGRRGEQVIARLRLWLVGALALVPVASVARDPGELGAWIGIAMALGMVGAAAMVLRLSRRVEAVRWLGVATSAFDITAVSLFHLVVLRAGDLPMAFNSRVTFALYLLALTATALRYDGRLCTMATGLAIAQWVGLVVWADASGLAARAQQAGRFYGDTHLAGQVEEIVVLLLAGALAGIVVSRARALRLSATMDGLTRLHNRAYFEERLGDELERAGRHGRPLALAMLDVDHFKRVNDTWGHPAGDAVLRAVAACLRAGVRRTDLVGRFGGEEFVIAFPETPLAEAHAKLEELRGDVAATRVAARGAKSMAVTISAGIAMFPGDGGSMDRLIACADERLLVAKRAGRNRVQTAAS